MPQAIQVEAEPEQQGLALLHRQQAAGRASREFALHRREDTLDASPVPIEPARKRSTHFCTHSADPPGLLPAFRWDHTPCSELLPDVGMVSLAVELGVGQHQPDAGLLGSRLHNNRQTRAVVPRATPRHLRQHALPVQVDHHDPLQPISPRQRFLPVMMQAADEEGAHRPRRQARGIDRHASPLSTATPYAGQPADGLVHRSGQGALVHTLEEAVQRGEIGYAPQPQCLAQFAVFPQAHLRFAKGPVLIPHQAQDSEKLRLRELVLAEPRSIGWEHRPTDFQGGAGKWQESNFRPSACCLLANGPFLRAGALKFSLVAGRMSTEPNDF